MEIFTIYKKDVNGRLDCYYYRPEFTSLEKKVSSKTNRILGDYILEIAGGATPRIEDSKKYYTDDLSTGIPFLRVQNVSPEGLKLDDIKLITLFTHENLLRRSQVSEYDLVTKITGVGRMAVSSVAPKGFIGNINQHLVVIKTQNHDTSRVLATFLNTDIGEKLANRRSTGGTRPALDYQALKTIPIIYEPQIVEIMDEAYARKKQNEEEAVRLLNSDTELINELIDINLDSSIQRKTFTINFEELEGALNSERYANSKALDARYTWTKIREIGDIVRDTFTPARTNPENDYGLIRIDDLENNPHETVIRNIKGNEINGIILKVQRNDILVARLGPTLENKKTILVPDYPQELIASNEFIRFHCHATVNPTFVLLMLKTDFYKNMMIQKSRGAVPSRRRLSHEDFAELPFPEIDRQIQDKLADMFVQNMNKAKQLRQEAFEALEKAKKEVERILFGGVQ